MALVGIPRIGKSSVAREALDRVEDEPSVIGVWIDIGSIAADGDFFKAVGAEIRCATDEVRAPDLAAQADPFEIFVDLRSSLRMLAAEGLRVVLVLDEFDAIRLHPQADVVVRRLRELIYQPTVNGVSVVITTRRPLHWIERTVPNLSTLNGVCTPSYLTPLSREHSAQVVERAGGRATSADEAELWSLFGGHPYCLEAALHEIWEGCSIAEAVARQRDSLDSEYLKLMQILESDSTVDIRALADDGSLVGDHTPLAQFGLLQHDPATRLWSKDFAGFVRERLDVTGAVAWRTDVPPG